MAKNKIPAGLLTRAAKLKYPAEFRTPLAAPIVRRRPVLFGLLDTPAEAEKREEERLKHEWLRKLAMLFRHYDLPAHQDNAYLLLLSIVRDWVPGFTVVNSSRPGKPPMPDEEALATYQQIEGLRLKLKSSRKELKSACEQFKKATGDTRTARALENVHRRGKAIAQKRAAFGASMPVLSSLPGSRPLTAVPRKRTNTRRKSAG